MNLIKRIRRALLAVSALATLSVLMLVPAQTNACSVPTGTLLGIPPWYKYLQGEEVEQKDGTVCQPKLTAPSGELPKKDLLLVAAAVLEMLIRVAGLAAFAFLIYGGFMYLTSSGNSESTKKAGSTILNAAIGLAISISATTLVNFFANKLSGG
jgi:hypothetical protein